jgi:hypothetical protein
MNEYEKKQEMKRSRFAELAKKNREEANKREKSAHQMLSMIPVGQPILVGHYSERRHRSDIRKIDNHMGKANEAAKKAEYYGQRADSVGECGISADDPDAIAKLKEKLAILESNQEYYKRVNKICKKLSIPSSERTANETKEKLIAAGLSENDAVRLLDYIRIAHYEKIVCYPPFYLTNRAAKIRSAKKRIDELEKRGYVPEHMGEESQIKKVFAGDGFKVIENRDINRIQFDFDKKPSEEVRKILKSNGFRWASSAGMWQRQLNGNGLYACRCVLNELKKIV